MSILTKRRTLILGALGGVGYWQFGGSSKTTSGVIDNTNDSVYAMGVAYNGDPTTIQRTGRVTEIRLAIEGSGATVVSFEAERPEETELELYNITTTRKITPHDRNTVGVTEVLNIPSGDYDITVTGTPGEWRCQIFDYPLDLKEHYITVPFTTSADGVGAIGPIHVDPKYPTRFTLELNTNGRVEAVKPNGSTRKTLFTTNQQSGGEYEFTEHFGGVGFLSIKTQKGWKLSAEYTSTNSESTKSAND